MPIPFLFIAIAAGTGLLGIGKSVKAGADKKTAKRVTEEANSILGSAKRRLNAARKKSAQGLEDLGRCKVRILDSSVNEFVRLFEKLKNVNLTNSTGLSELNKLMFDKQILKALKEMGGFASSFMGGVASGALGGALTAFGAYSAAGAFAAASTGTAISALSGAAATNATLAFFGGGSLAAGGLGMAGGTMVLGGLVAGPALAIMGFIVGAKASKAKDDAYSNLALARRNAKEMDLATTLCNAISARCEQFCVLLDQLDARFQPLVKALDDTIRMYGANYSKYPAKNKKLVAAAAAMAVSIKAVLDTPILTKDGQLTADSANVVANYKPDIKRLDACPATPKASTRSNKTSERFGFSLVVIIMQCSSERHRADQKGGVASTVRGLKGLYGKVDWEQFHRKVNASFGTEYDSKSLNELVDGYGEQTPVNLYNLFCQMAKLICIWQIGKIVQSCSEDDVLNSMVIDIEDVNWNKLIEKIDEYYGKQMAQWQLTDGEIDMRGQIAPQVIFDAILQEVSFQKDSESYLLHWDVLEDAMK